VEICSESKGAQWKKKWGGGGGVQKSNTCFALLGKAIIQRSKAFPLTNPDNFSVFVMLGSSVIFGVLGQWNLQTVIVLFGVS
jgi:hypothetical protein